MESRKEDQVPAPSTSKSEVKKMSGQEGFRALQDGIDTYHEERKAFVRTRRHMVGIPSDVHALLTKIATRHKRTLIGQIAFWVDNETII